MNDDQAVLVNSRERLVVAAARVLLVIAATVFALASAETIARWLWPESSEFRILRADLVETGVADIPFVYRPNTEFTNHLGLRNDASVTAAKPPKTLRVLIIGDSTTMARSVALPDLYTSRLADALTTRLEQRVEVLNLSLAGLSLRQEIALYHYKGKQLDPDLVVFAICANDLVDGRFDGIPLIAPSSSRLLTLARTAFQLRTSTEQGLGRWDDADGDARPQLEELFDMLGEIEREVLVAVTALPLLVDDVERQVHLRVIEALAGEYEIPYFDLSAGLEMSDLRRYRRKEFPDDSIHYGGSGHSALASALLEPLKEFITGRGLLRAREPSLQ